VTKKSQDYLLLLALARIQLAQGLKFHVIGPLSRTFYHPIVTTILIVTNPADKGTLISKDV
jgi:hypothetical protein